MGSADISGLSPSFAAPRVEALVFTGYLPDAITFSKAAHQAGLKKAYMHLAISLASPLAHDDVSGETLSDLNSA